MITCIPNAIVIPPKEKELAKKLHDYLLQEEISFGCNHSILGTTYTLFTRTNYDKVVKEFNLKQHETIIGWNY